LFRPIKQSDDTLIRDLFYDTSEHSVYQRFMNAKATYPRGEREAVVNIDYRTTMSIAATRWGPGPDELVALAEWRLAPETNRAEVAFLVRDDWQHRGLGARLLDYLTELAMERGILGFTAEVLAGNRGMLQVFQQGSQPVKTRLVEGNFEISVDFDPREVERLSQTGDAGCSPGLPGVD
jgi:GNAT superfamily N-acetyltransferase